MKLLIVEDDKDMAYSLKEQLSDTYVIELAFSGENGEYRASNNHYDVIMLDLLLPDSDGITICKKVRSHGIKTPILMLTGTYEVTQKVMALDAGADDYLLKPFHSDELRARIRALLRRQPEILVSNVLTVGDLQLDIIKKHVTRGDYHIRLKRKELQILEYLMRNAGKVVSRDMLLEHMWDSAYEPLTNTVDVHIKYLRDQIDKPFDRKLIKTIYGLGYKLEA
jgi:DNA-binding response OmpR family regulator